MTKYREFKNGDLVAFSGFGRSSIIVNLVTYGFPYWSASHVGIIGTYRGEQLLFESTSLSNVTCVIQGKPFKGVQAVHLQDRLDTYQGRAWHYPLYRQLYSAEEERLNKFLLKKIGTPYDLSGGMRSAGVGVSWLESRMRGEDLSLLFCSEYVVAAHRRIGILRTDNASRWSPNKLIRYERREKILLRPGRIL